MPGFFPAYSTSIERNHLEGDELAMARWEMPAPAFAPKKTNPCVTNVRNVQFHRLRYSC